ncbi:aldo/keto reductase [Aggregatilinea lenta]|uniref:aldo/keto reductase n=1 Tax=Aggregatilinea lenta TaxID=913108 RepID=UPI000E5B7F23|nr:aldo/keto reductase [Aggregatilinea lenta]
MKTVSLGHSDLAVAQIGLGCMGMSEFYGPSDEAQSITTLHRALELGVTLFDTADLYGNGHNERLLKKGIVDAGKRDQVVIATKFGFVRDPDTGAGRGISGAPDYVKAACDRSLQRLGIDTIDLYYQHRVDPQTPVEETVGAMAELVQAGKVRAIGLSEAGAETIRRAHAVHPITALQTEYSLWSRDVEGEILNTCRELGITLVAYSPLGRGFLTGTIASLDGLAEDDWRRNNPRFQGEALEQNMRMIEEIEAIATGKDATPAQIALAWVLAQGDDIVPIPGTRRIKYLEENVAAASITLTENDLARLNALPIPTGTRYPDMRLIGG